MHDCLDNPSAPKRGYCRAWIIIMISLMIFYYYFAYEINDIEVDSEVMKEINTGELKIGEVPCTLNNCNFDGLSQHMRNRMMDTLKDDPNLLPCSVNRLGLGKLEVNSTLIQVNLTRIQYPQVSLGGHFVPSDCQARHKVAIIVPYRDQEANLNIFIFNMHPFLMNQGIEYQMFIIEQSGDEKFNKGRLFNAGFKEAGRFGNWSCMVFHDADLLPLDARILYTCPSFPRHMSSAVLGHENDFKYRYFGGVVSMRTDHFVDVNGYSNAFWDCCEINSDMFWRIRRTGLRIARYDQTLANYLALDPVPTHGNYSKSIQQSPAAKKATRLEDGLNTLQYKVVTIRLRSLFTHIKVDVNPSRKEQHQKSKLAYLE